jgi:endoglucanase Acf2
MRQSWLSKYSVLLSVCLFAVVGGQQLYGQSVNVGKGSYSTTLPSGAIGPQNFNGVNVQPKISADFSQPIQSNDFWSSLIYPFFGIPHSNVLYAHPINAKATATGLQIGYTSTHVFAANDYLYPFRSQMTVGVNGLNANQTLTDSYGDWTVTASWQDANQSMKATLGHGLPFVFFTNITGGDALVSLASVPTVWFNESDVLGITINGVNYGLFAPKDAIWSITGTTIRSSLNANNFFSVALLPDNTPATLALFRQHAYAFVTDSKVNWSYDQATSNMQATYAYETTLMDSAAGNLNETMTALYRHQWLNTTEHLLNYKYQSPRGEMKVFAGNAFTNSHKFTGVMPALPDRGDYNREELLAFITETGNETLRVQGTYDNGKAMARFANLVHIADQIGAVTERDHFLSQMKNRLEDWLTVGGPQEYSYIDSWDVLTGYPSGFGADNQINDHHFHSAYAIMTAATIAQYDSTWAMPENWGGMINLLIKDSNNWDRSDSQFPFLRSFDAYAGHSWAAGHGDFGDGNNQESSSESMNFASAAVLWGEATGQPEIRDLGIYLYATESAAINQYWFDIDNEVFPQDYPHVAIGMVWGAKGVHSTWFGADPEYIHGINLLPMTAGSFYLGKDPEYVLANYNEVVAERNSQPILWKDIFWQYLAMSDADLALSYYLQDPGYEPFDGESRAHTLHWLYNLKKMGQPDLDIYADTPTFSVFKNAAGDKSYVAYNAGSVEKMVTFSDGYTMSVPPKKIISQSTFTENSDAPVAQIITDTRSGKAPLTVNFTGNKSFDRNGGTLSYYWTLSENVQSTSADTTYTFAEVGSHWVYLEVRNNQGISAKDSVQIEVVGNGNPFSGSPAMVPGRIEAEHYDKGGQGIAYSDADANNIGLAFRPNEGVDLENSNDGGFSIYWITAGEWVEYTFEVTEEGYYDFTPYVATVPGFGSFRLLIDNIDVSGEKAVRNTGGWQFWKPIPVERVFLTAGTHIMRYNFSSASDPKGWLFSLNYTNISKSVNTSLEEDERPTASSLNQNYPNPFNPSTNITYRMADAAQVRLEVFNILGQSVRVLVDEQKASGSYTLNFDASGLQSGMYLYRLSTNGFSQTRKMFLIK